MKKLMLVSMLALLLFAGKAAPRGSLYGWTVTGSITTVQDTGGRSYGKWSAAGFGAGGTISQTISHPGGDMYVFAVWCKGNPTVTLTTPGFTMSQSCENSATWKPLSFPGIPYTWLPGNVTVSAELHSGDMVDMFCLYRGACPPSMLGNPSFEP